MSKILKFDVPSSVTVNNFSTFLDKYSKWKSEVTEETKKVIVNFKTTSYLEPILIAFISAEEDEFKNKNITFEIESNNESNVDKFLKALGLLKQTPETLVKGYEKNLSNCALRIRRVNNSLQGLEVANKILPNILKRINCNNDVICGLNWALGEMIENAGNHGYRSYNAASFLGTVYVSSFAYKDRVEIVVLDKGQGIISSLSPNYPEIPAKEMLLHATKKSTSGHPEGSAGFGLHGSSRIAKSGGGSLYLISSGHGLKVTNTQVRSFQVSEYNGTIVSIGLTAGANIALKDCIERSAEDYIDLHGLEI